LIEKRRKVTWNQPIALGVLIVVITLTACTAHAMVSHWLRTSLERRKLRELKRYNNRQDELDRERSVLSQQRHPSSPGPVFTHHVPRNMPGPSPMFRAQYPAPPHAASPATVVRRPEDEVCATVIDITDYQTAFSDDHV
jgi:hypothetical protein